MRKSKHLFLGLFMFMAVFTSAQENTPNELVETYIEANGSLDQYAFAYDQLLKMLSQQYPKTAANAEGWKYLENNKEKAMNDMKTLLTPIYQQNFSQADITEMIGFYKTDTGQQLKKDRTQMTELQKQELNSYYNTEVGQKVIEKQSLLSTAISKASENWSRDLYETAVSLLKSE